VTRWLYNHATGLVTNKVYADNSRISYTHTQDGKPRRTTWARGAWKENAYDGLGQLTAISYSDATPDVSLNRNAFGTVTNVSDATGLTHVYAVNDRQSATNETVTISGDTVFTLDRALDGRNRVENARVTVGAEKLGETVFARDAEGRVSLVAVTNAADVGSRTFYGYESGRSSGWETPLGNGGTLRRVILRDPFRPDLVTGVSNTVDGVVVSAFGYGHGLTGKRAWQEDFDGYATVTNTFLYNASGEVTNAVLGADNHAYAYDPIGNRVWSAVNTLTNTYTANRLNQYTLISNPVNPVNPVQILPTYDADGNMRWDGKMRHFWDAENRLVQSQPYGIATNGAVRVVNRYDHRNRRVFKRVEILTGAEPVLPPSPPGNPGEWVEIRSTAFVWDNDRIAAEITSYTNGVVTTNAYFWGADMSGTADGAAGVGGLVRASLNGSDVLYCYDAHGNVTELVDAHSGAVVARYRYGVFGGTVRAEGPLAAANPWRFATRYHDGETGLIMFPRRPYSPGLGRFLSRDPIGTRGGLNEYGFVDNDPVNKHDHLGLYFGNQNLLLFILGVFESRHLGKGYFDPYKHCPAVNEGYYRHCLSSCVLNRLLQNPVLTMLIAMKYGGDLPYFDWDSGSLGDLISDLKGILLSYDAYSSCDRSCRESFDRTVKEKCCSSNVLWNKSDKRCCDEK
jgi:RHS repeat-associated protein